MYQGLKRHKIESETEVHDQIDIAYLLGVRDTIMTIASEVEGEGLNKPISELIDKLESPYGELEDWIETYEVDRFPQMLLKRALKELSQKPESEAEEEKLEGK